MTDSELSCEFCQKVYVKKGYLKNHIETKHQGEKRQTGQLAQDQLFQGIDIPEDMDMFPGGDEALVEAAEENELVEAAREAEEQLALQVLIA